MTPSQRTTWAVWLGRWLVVLLGLLFVAEAGLRWRGERPYRRTGRDRAAEAKSADAEQAVFQLDDDLGWRYPAGERRVVHAKQGDIGVELVQTHDALGHRLIPEPSSANQAIWVFGCGHTHGWGLADAEPYPARLQTLLAGCRVTNFAVDGYGVLQMLMQYRQARGQLPVPDLIVVGHVDEQLERACDSHRRRQRLTMGRCPLPAGARLPYAKPTPDGNYEVHYREATYRSLPGANWSAILAFADRRRVHWHDAKLPQRRVLLQIYKQFAAEAAADGVRFVVAGLGSREGWDDDLRHHGIRTIDAGIDIDFSRPDDRIGPTDYHPSSRAHRQFAANILEGMAEFGILRDRVPLGDWRLEVGFPHQARIETQDDRARVVIDHLATTESPLGLRRSRLQLVAGQAYRFRVQLQADAPREVDVEIAQAHRPWLSFYRRRFSVGTGPTTIEDTLIAADADASARFMLNLAGNKATLEAWDFSWNLTDAPAVTTPAVVPAVDPAVADAVAADAAPAPVVADSAVSPPANLPPPSDTGQPALAMPPQVQVTWALQVRDGGSAALEPTEQGTFRLRVDATGLGGPSVRLVSNLLDTSTGESSSIGLQFRASQPHAIRLSLVGSSGQSASERQIEVTDQWQPVDLPIPAAARGDSLRIFVDAAVAAPWTLEVAPAGRRP